MADTVTIPGTKSKVPKTAAYAGLAVVAVLIVVYYRNRRSKAAAAAVAPADTGVPVQAGGVGDGGGGGGGGTPPGPPFSTDAQWSAYVIAQLEANPNRNPTEVEDAIGEYVNGQPVTAAGKGVVFDAIAIGGDPPVAGPNGYPPKVRTAGTGQPGKTVTVPKVDGLRVRDATGVITRAGLRYRVNGTRRAGEPYWVSSQTPAAGTPEPAGSYVDLGITSRRP